jgi:TRAP-type C4-dicarboxylate transport system substrate-binding protein
MFNLIQQSLLHLFARFARTSCVLGLALSASCGFSQSETPSAHASLHLRIVGGLAGLNQFTHQEEPFWKYELAKISQGKYTAEIVPFDSAGVPANDMLRLLQLGVMPFGTTLVSGLSKAFPPYAVIDLAGFSPDIASLKKNVARFRPYLEMELRKRHNIKMLALYLYPAQVLFCNRPFKGLADLKGRHIRVSSVTQADFIGALGALPVSTSFSQIMSNMRSGNTDCAITGTMSGNTMGLPEVTSHIHSLPITWGLAVFGANQEAWNALPPDLKALLGSELPRLEAAIWLESEQETSEGMACNTGGADCKSGTKGQMIRIATSTNDEQIRQHTFDTAVLPSWLGRCGINCEAIWRQTLGATDKSSKASKP